MSIIKTVSLTMFGVIVVVGFIGLGMWGCPTYHVYQQGMAGSAELERAEQNRQIVIQEAMAENEAATSKAEAQIKIAEAQATAEIIHAKGAAEANAILGESLKDNEPYLRYLWIQGLQDGSSEVIYIPTEAGLPLLEARPR